MHQRDGDAQSAQLGQHLLEGGQLGCGVRHVLWVDAVGGREVGEDTLDDQARQRRQRLHERRGAAG